MRKFFLQNELGTRIDLNDTESYFLSNPSGLGMTQTFGYSSDGSGFASVAEKRREQINVVGDILISSNHYARYASLLGFIQSAARLSLCYQPYGSTEYYLDVECEYLTKTEIAAGVLTCPISLRGLTLWYKLTPRIINIIQPAQFENAFIYDAEYSMTYTLEGQTDTSITAGGHVPAAIDLYITHSLVNPTVSLIASDGELLGRCRLTGNVPNGATFRLCTKYSGESCVTVAGVNKINNVDITDNVFFRLPVGRSCFLSLTDDSHVDVNMTLYLYEYYTAV